MCILLCIRVHAFVCSCVCACMQTWGMHICVGVSVDNIPKVNLLIYLLIYAHVKYSQLEYSDIASLLHYYIPIVLIKQSVR